MKTNYLIYLFLFSFLLNSKAQISYFGQNPPGDSAIVFAPDFISTGDEFVQNSSFSPDGKEFYFAITNSNWYYIEIRYSRYETDHWKTPVKADLGNNRNGEPFFAPDSNRIFFNANSGNFDIWYCEKEDTSWSEPVKISAPVNTSSHEWFPSVSNKNTLFFSRNNNIYYSIPQNGNYNEVKNIGVPINSNSAEGDPFISPNEDYIIFISQRSGGYGQADLYISYKKENGSWTNPKNLGSKINTNEFELGPSVTPDGKYFLFTRREHSQTNKPSKIYWVSSHFIDSLKNTNFTPYLKNNIPNQTDTLGKFFSYTMPDSIFIDDDGNETLSFDAILTNGNDLPGTLTFNPETRTLSGILLELGSFNIKITATDTTGASASDIFKLKVESRISGLVQETLNDKISIYPNPVKGAIQIDSDISVQISQIMITDLTGKIIKKTDLNSRVIDISALTKGIYIINLQTSQGQINRKIIIE